MESLNQSLPGLRQNLILRENAILQLWLLDSSSQSCIIFISPPYPQTPHPQPHPPRPLLSSGEKDDEDDKEDEEDQKDLDHQPAVGGDGLEVLEDLHVSSLHV